MIIGILSLVLHSNYGGILQSYALQTVLEGMGHEVIVLNRNRDLHRSLSQEIRSYVKYLVKKCLLRRNIVYKSANQLNIERYEREVNTRAFIEKYIHTRMVKGLTNETFREMDAVIVGSDQVWRPRYFKQQWNTGIEDAYLRFLADGSMKRISYAASFGTDEWEYSEDETQKCTHLLQKFNAVSVREQSGVELCEKYLGRNDAKWILDPTMLLSKEDYEKLISKDMKASGDLMCYVLDENPTVTCLIKRVVEEGNYKAFYANSRVSDSKLPNKERIQPPVEQWLTGFSDARLVITDSFHACVFSILFNKPFIVIGNRRRGYSRFESLLKLFCLENRLIEDVSQFESSMFNPLSDEVYKRLAEYKKLSLEFLNKALTD